MKRFALLAALLLFVSSFPALPVASAATTSSSTTTTSQPLTTYTVAKSLTWAENFSDPSFHLDAPPSHFTFYPNGTVRLAVSSTVYLKWTFAIIPLQSPTSLEANSTYVSYTAKGPAGNTAIVSFKQQFVNGLPGNLALFGFASGTGSSWASSTFSISLKSYGSALETFDAKGCPASGCISPNGVITPQGAVCRVKLSQIVWDWCSATLQNIQVTYASGTIQLKNLVSNTAFAFLDPLGLDGTTVDYCQAASSCTKSLTTASSPDVLVLEIATICGSGTACPSSTGPATIGSVTDSASNTWTQRTSVTVNAAYSGCTTDCWRIEEWYTTWSSSGTLSVTASITGGGNVGTNGFIEMILLGVSGADTASPFDSNAAIPASATANNPSVTVSTNNANDFLISGFVGTSSGCGSFTQPSNPSSFTVIGASNNFSVCGAYKIVSSTLSSASEAWSGGGTAGMTFDAIKQASSTVTQPLNVGRESTFGGSDQTITITGSCSPSPSTFTGDNTTHNVSMNANCNYGLSVPSGYTLKTSTGTTCASGTCSTANFVYYYSLVKLGIKITTSPAGAPSGTITIAGSCGFSNSTFTADSYTHIWSGLTPSCSYSLSTSGQSGDTRYSWNVSPHPSSAFSITPPSTCAGPGTCTTYTNTTYYQLSNAYTLTPQTPSSWDGAYSGTTYGPYLSGTYLGSSGYKAACNPGTTSGGGAVTCPQPYVVNPEVIAAPGVASSASGVYFGTLVSPSLVLVLVQIENTQATSCTGMAKPAGVSSVSGAGLTYHQRATVLSAASLVSSTCYQFRLSEYYGRANTTLGQVTAFSVSLNASSNVVVMVIPVAGINRLQPFDPNAASSCTSSGTSTSVACSVSTSNPTDLILGFPDFYFGTFTYNSGFSAIDSYATSRCSSLVEISCAEGMGTSATKSSLSVGLTQATSAIYAMIGDSIQGQTWFDYDLATTASSIGSWTAQSPSSFTDTTGGNVHNVNYVQSSGGGSGNNSLLIIGALFGAGFGMIVIRRKGYGGESL